MADSMCACFVSPSQPLPDTPRTARSYARTSSRGSSLRVEVSHRAIKLWATDSYSAGSLDDEVRQGFGHPIHQRLQGVPQGVVAEVVRELHGRQCGLEPEIGDQLAGSFRAGGAAVRPEGVDRFDPTSASDGEDHVPYAVGPGTGDRQRGRDLDPQTAAEDTAPRQARVPQRRRRIGFLGKQLRRPQRFPAGQRQQGQVERVDRHPVVGLSIGRYAGRPLWPGQGGAAGSMSQARTGRGPTGQQPAMNGSTVVRAVSGG